MEEKELITVIVPAYNVAEWLPRCLDSILKQTCNDLEILVIDDGSTDATGKIADEYGKKDKRIRIIHQENRGLAATRERGIEEARGEYIGFVDGDDEIIPEMYEKLAGNALKYHAQISQCGIMYCFYDGKRQPVHGSGKLTVYDRRQGCAALLLGKEMEPSLCNKIYHSSIIKDSCLDSSIINNEDKLRNIVLFDRAECSVMEDFCGYLYWRRDNSMSNNLNAAGIGKNILRARKRILDYVPEDLKTEAWSDYTAGAVGTYNSLMDDRTPEGASLRKECRQIIREGLALSKSLSRGRRIRAFLILYLPRLYQVLEKTYSRLSDGRS